MPQAMPPIFQAELDIGTLIYIILVFFWLIGNAFGKKKKGRQAPRIPSPDETSAERELREMLETLAGNPKPVEELEEELPAAPEPAEVFRRHALPKATQAQIIPLAQPMPRSVAPAPAYERASLNIEELSRELRESAPMAGASFSSTLSSMASLFKTSGLTMPALRYALNSSVSRTSNPVLTNNLLLDKAQLRRIVAGRIVLGPPRALEPYRADTEATRAEH